MPRLRRVIPAILLSLFACAAIARAEVVVEDPDPVQRYPGMGNDARPVTLSEGNWRLLLDPVETPVPPAVAPLPRILHAAIFDAANQRMVVSGGLMFSLAHNDVWTMDLSGPGHAWTQLATVGSLGGRRDHSAIYDPLRQRMVVFGGSLADNAFFNDVWQLTLGATPTWSPVPTTGTPPPGRFSHTAMYDPVRDRMLVFGGYTGAFVNDTWQLDFTTSPATWSPISAGGPPSARNAMTAVYDPIGDRMLIFGGFGNGTFKGDLWALRLSGSPAWTQLAPGGSLPAERRHYAAAVDPTRKRLIISGGQNFAFGSTTQNLADTYQLSFADLTWTQITVSGPSARSAHRAVYSPLLDEFVLFGGYNDPSGYLADAWRLINPASPSWQLIVPAFDPGQAAPTPRRDHSAVIDNVNRMVIFGGWDGDYLNDVWTLGLNGPPVWTAVSTLGTPPPPRFAHTSIWDPVRNRMLVFGGYDGTFRGDLWQLSFDGTPTWTQLVPAGATPGGRNAMTAVYDAPRRRMVVFSGWNGINFIDDVWALSLDGAPVWSNITSGRGKSPAPRRHYAAIYDPNSDCMVISGGFDLTYRGDSWELDLDKNKWSRINVGRNAAPERNAHRAVLDAARRSMVIFGGYGGSNVSPTYLNDSWLLPLDHHRRWARLLPTGTPPSARLLYSAVFDAAHDRMLMFGGLDGASELNDLWALEFAGSAATPRTPENMGSRNIPKATEFAVHGAYPNPASGPFRVEFSLAGSEAGTLGIYAVNGRRVASREVGSLGRGRHVIRFAERFSPGIYWVRLSQAGNTRTVKTAIIK